MKKPDWIDVDKDKMNGSQFFKELVEVFPELEEDINWYDEDLIHLRLEEFSRYTNKQISSGNEKQLIRCFDFIEKRLSRINLDLENAINVSFCETLLTENSDEVMAGITKLMYPKLKWYYDEYKKYYEDLSNKSNQSNLNK